MRAETEKIVARATAKFEAGELAIAAHLIDWAAMVAPDDKQVHEARAKIYAARAEQASSTMSFGIFRRGGGRIGTKGGNHVSGESAALLRGDRPASHGAAHRLRHRVR